MYAVLKVNTTHARHQYSKRLTLSWTTQMARNRGGVAQRSGALDHRYTGKMRTSQRIAGVSSFDRNRVGTKHRCSPEVWRKICEAVKNRDGHRCVRCGSTEKLTVDHIIPHSQGGSDLPSNLRTLCIICHKNRIGRANRRGSKLLEARFK